MRALPIEVQNQWAGMINEDSAETKELFDLGYLEFENDSYFKFMPSAERWCETN